MTMPMTDTDRLPPAREGATLNLLEGVRVLDLTTSVSGPYTTLLLADLGATVVKVEQPGQGDDVRAWGPPFLDGESLWFLSINRNKHSLTLDYSKPEGLDVLRRMVACADVVVIVLSPSTNASFMHRFPASGSKARAVRCLATT